MEATQAQEETGRKNPISHGLKMIIMGWAIVIAILFTNAELRRIARAIENSDRATPGRRQMRQTKITT